MKTLTFLAVATVWAGSVCTKAQRVDTPYERDLRLRSIEGLSSANSARRVMPSLHKRAPGSRDKGKASGSTKPSLPVQGSSKQAGSQKPPLSGQGPSTANKHPKAPPTVQGKGMESNNIATQPSAQDQRRIREGEFTASAAALKYASRGMLISETAQQKAYKARSKMALALNKNYPNSAAILYAGTKQAQHDSKKAAESLYTTSEMAHHLVTAHGREERPAEAFSGLNNLREQSMNMASRAAASRARVGNHARILAGAISPDKAKNMQTMRLNGKIDRAVGDIAFPEKRLSDAARDEFAVRYDAQKGEIV